MTKGCVAKAAVGAKVFVGRANNVWARWWVENAVESRVGQIPKRSGWMFQDWSFRDRDFRDVRGILEATIQEKQLILAGASGDGEVVIGRKRTHHRGSHPHDNNNGGGMRCVSSPGWERRVQKPAKGWNHSKKWSHFYKYGLKEFCVIFINKKQVF